jgi:hypothetical protein
MLMNELTYAGKELSLFSKAVNWKKYLASKIRPFLGCRVVEVGAGIGATTSILCDGLQQEWICLEPDPVLRNEIDARIAAHQLPTCCHTRGGFVRDLDICQRIDSFLYIDVLEHIREDRYELQSAADRLAPGGTLIVLSPAFNFLYSRFDQAIGHHRRYDKPMLVDRTPRGCRVETIFYLDSIGMATSIINKMVLWQSLPNEKQILFWDRWLIALSRKVDPIMGYSVGRSIVCVWKKFQ